MRRRRGLASTTRSTTATAAPTRAPSPSTSPASTTTRSPATTPPRSPRTRDRRHRERPRGNDTDVDRRHPVGHRRRPTPTGGTVALDAASSPSPLTPTCAATPRPLRLHGRRRHGGTDTGHGHGSTSRASTTTRSPDDDDASGTEDTDVVITTADLAARRLRRRRRRLAVTGVDNASGGTVSLDAGTITFVPDANLCGDDAASLRLHGRRRQRRHRHGHRHHRPHLRQRRPRGRRRHGIGRGQLRPPPTTTCSTTTRTSTLDTLTLESAAVDLGTRAPRASNGGMVSFTPADRLQRPGRDHVHHQRRHRHRQHATLTITVGGDVDRPGRHGPDASPSPPGGSTRRPRSGSRGRRRTSRRAWPSTRSRSASPATPYKTIYAGTGTSIIKVYAFKQRLVFRSGRRTHEGNGSGWVTSPRPARSSPYQNTQPVRRVRAHVDAR